MTRTPHGSLLRIILLLACAAACLWPQRDGTAHGGEAVPANTPVYMETTDLGGLERLGMIYANAFNPSAANTASLEGLDDIFRKLQRSGQLPSFAAPVIQQFFGIPGFDLNRSKGLAAAFFSPRPDEDENPSALVFAAWLPVVNFAAVANGIASGQPEWRHIDELENAPGVYTIDYDTYGAQTMYMAGSAAGVFLSTTRWGLERARRVWGTGVSRFALNVRQGFAAKMLVDMRGPGAEAGLAKLLEASVERLAERLRLGFDLLAGDHLVKGILYAMLEANDAECLFTADAAGSMRLIVGLQAKAGGDLAAALTESSRRRLDSRLVRAMPGRPSIMLAAVGGMKMREAVGQLLNNVIGEADAHDSEVDAATRRLLLWLPLLFAASDDNLGIGVTVRGEAMAAFDAADPSAAALLAKGASAQGKTIGVGSQGRTVLVGLGNDAPVLVENMRAGLDGSSGQKPLHPAFESLFSSLGDDGILAFSLIPADVVRLVIGYKIRETYMTASQTPEENQLDMFTTAYLGKLMRGLDETPPGRHAFSLGASAGGGGKLKVDCLLSIFAFSEIMKVYQNMIFSVTPGYTGE